VVLLIMARPKKPKLPKPPPINKKHLVERLVEKPSHGLREWLMREYVILKKLSALFPLEFLNQLKYSKKFASLAVLFCDNLMLELTRKYRAYLYVPPQKEEIILGDKAGEDYQIQKRPTLRDLLK